MCERAGLPGGGEDRAAATRAAEACCGALVRRWASPLAAARAGRRVSSCNRGGEDGTPTHALVGHRRNADRPARRRHAALDRRSCPTPKARRSSTSTPRGWPIRWHRPGDLPAVRRDQNVEPEEAGFRDRGIKLRGRDAEGHAWGATIYGPHGRGYSAEDPDAISPRQPATPMPANRAKPIRAEEATVPPIAPPPRCAAWPHCYANDLESATARRNSVASQPCS